MTQLCPRFACALLVFALVAPPAHAVNKDMVQLQTQVQELQTSVARLQQSNDERMGVLRDLVQQSTDTINKMPVAIDGLQLQMRAQHDSSIAKTDQVSSQVQSLNDSLDEVKARLNNVEKVLQSLQNQQQSIDAAMQNIAPSPAASGAGTATPPASNSSFPPQSVTHGTLPADALPSPITPPPPAPSSKASTPTVAALYKTALSDWMAAQYPLATTEFNEIVRTYPTDPLAGNAFYYLGEIEYRNGKYSSAIKDYDHVLDQFPDNPKVPVSHLHKGQALFEIGKREAGIAELRTLIARFPHAPEAAQARSKLSGMGVSATPKRPA